MALSETTRGKLIDILTESMLASCFGDGLERDYVLDGFPEHKGYRNYTDKELVEEAIEREELLDFTPEERQEFGIKGR